MSALASLFARVEIGLTALELGIVLLIVEIFASVGGVFHLWLQKKCNWNSRQMLIYHLISYSIGMAYILLGLINKFPLGLKSKIEMFIFSGYYGLHFGSIQSYGRALSSNLIPMDKENKIFSLLAITDRGSSWIGPLITTFVSNIAGLRYALFYIITFYIIGIIIIYYIDLDKGIQQSGKIQTFKETETDLNGHPNVTNQ